MPKRTLPEILVVVQYLKGVKNAYLGSINHQQMDISPPLLPGREGGGGSKLPNAASESHLAIFGKFTYLLEKSPDQKMRQLDYNFL